MQIIEKYHSELDKNRTIYQCAICNKLFNWNENSSWFGSYDQLEKDFELILFFCSKECEDKHNQSKN